MNGRVGKRIRREVYGDLSPRAEARKYFLKWRRVLVPKKDQHSGKILRDKEGKVVMMKVKMYQLFADDKRRQYQKAKKAYYAKRVV